MSKRGPRQDGEAAQLTLDVERVVELRDDPELPMEQRLERSAGRFELLVRRLGIVDAKTDIPQRLEEIEKWTNIIEGVERNPLHAEDPVALAEAKLVSTTGNDRKREVSNQRSKGRPEDRRQEAYSRAAEDAEKRVIDHHGAARWKSRPGNHERLDDLYDALQGHVMDRTSARTS